MNSLLQRVLSGRRVIILTFELFWIVVFLLDAAAGSGGGEVAPFVYANF